LDALCRAMIEPRPRITRYFAILAQEHEPLHVENGEAMSLEAGNMLVSQRPQNAIHMHYRKAQIRSDMLVSQRHVERVRRDQLATAKPLVEIKYHHRQSPTRIAA